MKTVPMADEPTTKQRRTLDVTLGNLSATCQVKLLNKDDKSVIMTGEQTGVNIGMHFGQQEGDSDAVKNAKLVAIDTIEGAVAELYKVMNP